MFEKKIETAEFLSPLNDFEADAQPIEYRRDALTNRWCRINIKRTERIKQGQGRVDYSELIERSAERCFFCPANIAKDTPKFLPGIVQEGRIKLGEAVVFPNLFPFAEHHAIATISSKHFLDLPEFTQRQIEDTLQVSIDYFRRVHGHDENVAYTTFNWNHLPPSGASIVHPHIQLIADRRPPYLTHVFLKASVEYYKRHKENYWLKLAREEERLGERFITRIGKISWLTSFVPLGNNEVNAIFEDALTLTELTPTQISDFVKGLKNILAGYSKLGVKSFNLTTYSAPIGEKRDDFCLNVKMVSRPSPRRYYTADNGFMETLHSERIVEAMPEKVAKEMKKFF